MRQTLFIGLMVALGCTSGGGDETAGSTGAASADTTATPTTGADTGEAPTGGTTTASVGSTSGAAETTAGEATSEDTNVETTAGDATSEDTTTGVAAGPVLLVCSFIADSVTRFDLATGEFLGELGASEDLDGALGVTVGPDGDIYVASEEANMVLRYDGASGAFVGRFVWDDPQTPDDETGGLSGPGAVLFGPDGMLYVSSFDSDAVLRYDGATGAFDSVFVAEGSGGLNGPDAGMVFGPGGDLFVPGYYSNTVSRFAGATGDPLPNFTPTDLLQEPRTLVFHEGYLYVANEGSDEVLRYDGATGEFVDVFVAAGAGGLSAPAGMVFGPDGVLHVASVNTNTVLRYDADGAPLPGLIDGPGAGIAGPTHIALLP